MLHLRLDGNKADWKMRILMSRSLVMSSLETTLQLSAKYCFSILFVDFYAVKVKETALTF